MLAYNGLALITEKLQNQRLEEGDAAVGSSMCGINNNNNNNSSSSNNNNIANTFCGTNRLPLTPDTRTHSQANFAVKGKNVWASAVESERLVIEDLPCSPKLLRRSDRPSASICKHKKLRHICFACGEIASSSTPAPPKKKHCRSLSVPPDGSNPLPTPGRDTKIWRPIAVIPNNNNNNNNDTSSTSSLDVDNNNVVSTTNCALSTNGLINNNMFLTRKEATSLSAPLNAPNILPAFPEASHTGKWLPRLSKSGSFVKLLSSPSLVPSPPSVDSGHFTTSDLTTPPGSPVPRPASAASSDVSSFSSLSSPWMDAFPHRSARLRVLENRSLSLEDRISGPAHSVLDSARSCHVTEGCDGCGGVTGVIPRCHSQPCILHSRRSGKKRRRDCDTRPTLNFTKMTETAYSTRSHRRSEPWTTGLAEHQMRVPGLHAFPSLNTIASSPSDLPSYLSPAPPTATLTSATRSDLDLAASVALPLTPPEQAFSFLCRHKAMEEEEEADLGDCGCHDSRTDDGVGLFPMIDLDLDQIENH